MIRSHGKHRGINPSDDPCPFLSRRLILIGWSHQHLIQIPLVTAFSTAIITITLDYGSDHDFPRLNGIPSLDTGNALANCDKLENHQIY